jgi:hypothetical protein
MENPQMITRQLKAFLFLVLIATSAPSHAVFGGWFDSWFGSSEEPAASSEGGCPKGPGDEGQTVAEEMLCKTKLTNGEREKMESETIKETTPSVCSKFGCILKERGSFATEGKFSSKFRSAIEKRIKEKEAAKHIKKLFSIGSVLSAGVMQSADIRERVFSDEHQKICSPENLASLLTRPITNVPNCEQKCLKSENKHILEQQLLGIFKSSGSICKQGRGQPQNGLCEFINDPKIQSCTKRGGSDSKTLKCIMEMSRKAMIGKTVTRLNNFYGKWSDHANVRANYEHRIRVKLSQIVNGKLDKKTYESLVSTNIALENFIIEKHPDEYVKNHPAMDLKKYYEAWLSLKDKDPSSEERKAFEKDFNEKFKDLLTPFVQYANEYPINGKNGLELLFSDIEKFSVEARDENGEVIKNENGETELDLDASKLINSFIGTASGEAYTSCLLLYRSFHESCNETVDGIVSIDRLVPDLDLSENEDKSNVQSGVKDDVISDLKNELLKVDPTLDEDKLQLGLGSLACYVKAKSSKSELNANEFSLDRIMGNEGDQVFSYSQDSNTAENKVTCDLEAFGDKFDIPEDVIEQAQLEEADKGKLAGDTDSVGKGVAAAKAEDSYASMFGKRKTGNSKSDVDRNIPGTTFGNALRELYPNKIKSDRNKRSDSLATDYYDSGSSEDLADVFDSPERSSFDSLGTSKTSIVHETAPIDRGSPGATSSLRVEPTSAPVQSAVAEMDSGFMEVPTPESTDVVAPVFADAYRAPANAPLAQGPNTIRPNDNRPRAGSLTDDQNEELLRLEEELAEAKRELADLKDPEISAPTVTTAATTTDTQTATGVTPARTSGTVVSHTPTNTATAVSAAPASAPVVAAPTAVSSTLADSGRDGAATGPTSGSGSLKPSASGARGAARGSGLTLSLSASTVDDIDFDELNSQVGEVPADDFSMVVQLENGEYYEVELILNAANQKVIAYGNDGKPKMKKIEAKAGLLAESAPDIPLRREPGSDISDEERAEDMRALWKEATDLIEREVGNR